MAEEDKSKKKTNNPKSYQGRKECIKRKSMELATLCDIKVCTVITEVFDLYSLNLKPEKKHKESSTPVPYPEEEKGEKDLLTLVESNLAAVNRRICFVENKNVVVADKGKRKRIE
ncbi:hypothetical protein R3W88_029491 [Solanum pinnatisectum]|uniref:MADS-box domain-containing protein n=1 Tax=Solanum pinnatisectum TaxID=50273 RepID=A0AAV9K5H1_9SOLN|nr:hypothetical protein R3W88_029491 [Solanum pinnatisectum]